LISKKIGPAFLNLINPKLTALRIDVRPSEIRILLPDPTEPGLRSVKELCEHYQYHICINANFFDELDKPLGLVISGGQLKNVLHNSGSVLTGIFLTDSNSFDIVHRIDVHESQVLEAFQAGPRLISNGEKVAGLQKDQRNTRRSGVCITEKNQLILWIVQGGMGGVRLHTLQDIFLAEPFHCRQALNLDGGGSSQLYISSQIPGAQSDFKGLHYAGEGPIPVALGIRFRPEE
jgi:uncharacterized protein YigE (DUF2233 family)